MVATIISDADSYAQDVAEKLNEEGFRAEADIRNEKIGFKVREHSVGHVPLIFAVGEREVADGTVSVRRLGEKRVETMQLSKAIEQFKLDATPPDLREDSGSSMQMPRPEMQMLDA